MLSTIDADLRNGVGYLLSEMKDAYNNLIDITEHKTFTNKELKVPLLYPFGVKRYLLLFHQILCKSAMVYVSNIDKNDIAETVQNFNPIKETALKMSEIFTLRE